MSHIIPRRLARTILIAPLIATLGLSIAGCSSDDQPDSGDDAAVSNHGGSDGFAADSTDDATDDAGPTFTPLALSPCAGTTRLRRDPAAGIVDTFPDHALTVDDPTTATGLRVATRPDDDIPLSEATSGFWRVFEDLSRLDGFGATAGMSLSFDGPIDASGLPAVATHTVDAESPVVLLDLDATPPAAVAFRYETVRECAEGETPPAEIGSCAAETLMLWPLAALRPGRHYGLAVITPEGAEDAALKSGDGTCLSPDPWTVAALSRDATALPEVERARAERLFAPTDKLIAALQELGRLPSDDVAARERVAVAIPFTTQSAIDTDLAVADAIRARTDAADPHAWIVAGAEPPCTVPAGKPYRVCDAQIEVDDFRDAEGYMQELSADGALPTPSARYTLPVRTFLPLLPPDGPPVPASGRYPVILFGHGLSGSRDQAKLLAVYAAPEGIATVAIDAVKHGGHADPASGSGLAAVFDFFGLQIDFSDPLDVRRQAGHWRQAAFDKLHLVEALRGVGNAGVDVDGDGTPDIAVRPDGPDADDNLVYLGASLGGIMGAQFVALSDALAAAVFIVPGGRVLDIIKDAETFAPIIGLMRGTASDGQVDRFFPLAQTGVERGDAALWTRHVLTERLPGREDSAPHVLMQMVVDDDTVPNTTNRAFAAGLGGPVIGDLLIAMDGNEHRPSAPVSGNVTTSDGATRTGGVFLFDVVYTPDLQGLRKATHDNVSDDAMAVAQSIPFVRDVFAGKTPAIVDPYRVEGVKP